jgi:hypothetical protein
MALPSELTDRRGDRGSKLGNAVRLLSSNEKGDVITAAHGILRLLASCGADIHTLAAHIENGSGLTEADKQKIRSEIEHARAVGYAEGVRAAQTNQHGAGAFRNTDGKLEFGEVALYVQREMRRLRPGTHEFVNKMALYAVEGFEPSKKQGKYLFDLFLELGGKIT